MKPMLTTLLTITIGQAIVFAQNADCGDCIGWNSEHRLGWEDFRGKPRTSSVNKAITDTGISIAFACENNEAEITVNCYFNPSKSWTKTTESKNLLAHEQLHFDITELFTRQLRKALEELPADCEKAHKDLGKIYDRNYEAYAKYQAQYDRETQHSIDNAEQLRWEKLVSDELKKLEAFSSDN